MGCAPEAKDRKLREHLSIPAPDAELVHYNLVQWSSNQQGVAIYCSNTAHQLQTNCIASDLELIAGIGIAQEVAFDKAPSNGLQGHLRYSGLSPHFLSLQVWHDTYQDWLFGHIAYDLKNEIENLATSGSNRIGFSLMRFFQPHYVFELKGGQLHLQYLPKECNHEQAKEILNRITDPFCFGYHKSVSQSHTKTIQEQISASAVSLNCKISNEAYIQNVARIQEQIRLGNTYELNYCIEFFAEHSSINPQQTYMQLNQHARAPFAAYYKVGDAHLLCASPERFIVKNKTKVSSQPIKGTAPRHPDATTDIAIKKQLLQSKKERTENTMIVDLVRNDLAKNAQPNTLKVDELMGIYSFKHVHQLISTISIDVLPELPFAKIIQDAFPMGSMTGVPKVSAMQIIEETENMARGLYSGAVGYVTPNADFDFNVVIRSIQYNQATSYVSLMVGSAITSHSLAQAEYEECMVKAKGLMDVLQLPTLVNKQPQ